MSLPEASTDGREAQFRKFATAVECQGQGLGSLLLQHLRSESRFSPFWRLLGSDFSRGLRRLGPPARCPFNYQFFWGSPTKIDYITKGTLILTSLLEDLEGNLLVSLIWSIHGCRWESFCIVACCLTS